MASSSSSSDSSSAASDRSTPPPPQKSHKRKRAPPPEDSSDSDSDAPQDGADAEENADDAAMEEDVPVLSHAEQRRQKKKQQQKAAKAQIEDADEDAAPKAKAQKVKNTAELAPSKLPKRQNSVWVGNLTFKTTPEALRTFFAGCGEITRVHMPMKMASTGPGGRGAVKQNRGSVCSLRLRAGLDVIFVFPDLRTSTLRRPTRRRSPLRCRKIR